MASVAKVTWTHDGVAKTAWVVRYKDGAGTRRQRKCPSKKAADNLRLKIENEIERGEHVAKSQTITVNQLCDLYLEHAEQRATDGRIGHARVVQLKSYLVVIRAKLGARKLTELTPQMIEQFYADQCRTPGRNLLLPASFTKGRSRADGIVSPTTAKTKVRLLRQMQDFAIKRRYMGARPATEALADLRGVAPPKKIRTFDVDHIGRLLEAAKERSAPRSRKRTQPMLECMVHIAVFCGLRFGEIIGLTLDDVDLMRRVLHVRRSFNQHVGLKSPKTKSGIRDVPMPTHLAVMLRVWIDRHRLPNDLGLVFHGSTGTPLKYANFHHAMWRPLLKRAGLLEADAFHFHALRHFAASVMIDNGLSMPDVAELLGHSKFDTTLQVYAHPIVRGGRQHEAIERIASRIIAAPLTIDEPLVAGAVFNEAEPQVRKPTSTSSVEVSV